MLHFLFAISILFVLNNGDAASSTYLREENNFHKMNMERNNKVNTRVWRRGGKSDAKIYHGNYFFAGASPVESLGENHEEGGAEDNTNNDVDASVANYFSRFKRGARNEYDAKDNENRYATPCKGDNVNCIETAADTIPANEVKPEFISKIKPASVFNDYPYEIALLLNDDLNEIVKQANNNDLSKNNDVELKVVPLTDGKDYVDIYVTPTDRIVDINEIYEKLKEAANHTINTINATRRPNDYETEIIKNMIFTDSVNGTDDTGKPNRNIIMGIFNKEHQAWPQKPPKIEVRNNNIIVPKAKNTIVSKTINGEGLIKVLSMLTKTFKRVMKQHEDIKRIQGNFHVATNDFTKTIDDMTKRLHDFQEKYNVMVELGKKIATTEAKIQEKHGQIEKERKELSGNLAKFLEHQKKFMLLQTQFYETQKAVLAQNQDISQRQSLIARSQNTVSHRQNEFARIIQKVKKLYNSRKSSKLSPNLKVKSEQKAKDVSTSRKPLKYNVTETKEPVKINLFSIPVKEKLKNQDQSLLSEKDEQSIDDIVYKFYFNNTFIDNLLKTGVLASFVNEPVPSGPKEVKKRSRDEIDKLLEKTILLPITTSSSNTEAPFKRQRRWISRSERKIKQKKLPVANRFKVYDDSETQHKKKTHRTPHNQHNIETTTENKALEDTQIKLEKYQNIATLGMDNPNIDDISNPYRLMATNFCNQIKQNTNSQILNWCIEKALRKLKAIDVKMSLLPLEKKDKPAKTIDNVEPLAKTIHTFRKINPKSTPTLRSAAETGTAKTGETTSSPGSQDTIVAMFFPDNDQLESNLKQYEIVPDTEGTVFFDGSLHSSKMVTEDEALSDVMPGMDSNSHVDIDPNALEIQAQRRAYVRNFNAQILKNGSSR